MKIISLSDVSERRANGCSAPRSPRLGRVAEHGAVEAIEIERKYAVTDTAVLPALDALGGSVPAQITTDEYGLKAVYFDTAEGALGGLKVAVRRREGGSDAGWHLKTKNGDRSRELMWPLTDEMPRGLRDALTALIGSDAVEAIRPIATLATVRKVTRWAPNTEAWVLEIADDTVCGTNELTGVVQQWREWEAELAPGADQVWLERVDPLLQLAGAVREHGTSKLQRVMARPVQSSKNSAAEA